MSFIILASSARTTRFRMSAELSAISALNFCLTLWSSSTCSNHHVVCEHSLVEGDIITFRMSLQEKTLLSSSAYDKVRENQNDMFVFQTPLRIVCA